MAGQRVTQSQDVLDRLLRYECRNITYQDRSVDWPIVWERARDCRVWDLDGRQYLDLTAAFGVAAAGHANPAVVRAATHQISHLMHAMGDVHPHRLKADLAQCLSELTFERWVRRGPKAKRSGKTLFGSSGFEAVEAALKTAHLATGRPGVIAFEGGYHGLGYGALNTTHREEFRGPFRRQLREFGHFVAYPDCDRCDCPAPGPAAGMRLGQRCGGMKGWELQVREWAKSQSIGAVLVEPVQARGGIRVPPLDFLRRLRSLCDELGMLLIVDEVYTGFGRTGAWFACEHSGVVPDVICLGKAMTGGFPLSACVGRADIMDQAWPVASGEAIHTSTFLGHPVGCAMALAQIHELIRRDLPMQSAVRGDALLGQLHRLADEPWPWRLRPRGLGLMVGLEFTLPDGQPASALVLKIVQALLKRGYILLPEGAQGHVLGFTPPLIISDGALSRTVRALRTVLKELV
jgi:4-aminobutyrate aminotransferase-like enzyme